MNQINKIFIIILIIVFPFLNRCKEEARPDISGIDVEININRFEQDIFNVPLDSIKAYIPSWQEKYGAFFPIFNRRVINIGSAANPAYPHNLKAFITNYDMHLLYSTATAKFPSLHKIESELEQAFRYFRYYFPDKEIPMVVSMISGLTQSVITVDSILAVALDKYLGRDEDIYKQARLYNYLIYNMHPGKIPSDCMRAWGMKEFEMEDQGSTLLDHLLYEGKIMYFTQKMLPGESDTLIWGFTPEQMDFCRNNEEQMWVFLVENNLLFKTDLATINKYTREGPFTRDFTNESPARAAVWLGMQIIKEFMRKNKEYDLPALMEENDNEKILRLSKYNP